MMVSYFYFRKGLNEFSGSPSEFIRSTSYGIEKRVRHVESWMDKSEASQSINFLKFEELKEHTSKALNTIDKQLGHDIPEKIIKKYVELSSFDNMKKEEEFYRVGNQKKT